LEGSHALAAQVETKRPRARDERRAARERRGNRRHQHRLLRVGRAAEAAVAEVPAAADVAPDRAVREAEALGAERERRVVGVGRLRPRDHSDARFGVLEPRREVGGPESIDAPFSVPVVERRRRRAKRARPVDRRAAADAASLQDADRVVRGAPRSFVLVEIAVGLVLMHVEIGRGPERAFLDHHHREPRLREDFRRGAAARARADDRDVGFERRVARCPRRVDHLPAGGETGADRVDDRTRHDSTGGPG
jgi:hypothetical protein